MAVVLAGEVMSTGLELAGEWMRREGLAGFHL